MDVDVEQSTADKQKERFDANEIKAGRKRLEKVTLKKEFF
jgi:hypothetical protein